MIKKIYKYWLVTIVLPGMLSGCLGTRYLKPGERLLYRQSISAPKGFVTEGFNDLYTQKANRKVLGLPINSLVWMYYTGLKRFRPETFVARRDSVEKKFNRKIEAAHSQKRKSNLQFRKQKKIDGYNVKIDNGNLFMQWGEKVSVFDSAQVQATADRLDGALFAKGYLMPKTTFKTTAAKNTVIVKYIISPGPGYFYDSIAWDVADTLVAALIDKNKELSLVKKGDLLDQDKLNKERERIDFFLKDNGYFDFSRQYVDFDVDTSYKSGHRVALRIVINNPAKRDYHKQFRIDSVAFTTDASTIQKPGKIKRETKVYRDITFSYFNDQYSKKILAQRVFIKKDSLYSRSATFSTQQRLSNLDVFKFVNINYDTSGGRFIANIFTSPMDRYSWSNEAGMTVTQGFPGPYYNMSFRKRNIFRGLESFDINGRFGFEGVASATHTGNFYKSTEASINGTLTFPQFLIPLSPSSGYRFAKYNPKTKVLAGYTYTDRPEYTRAINTISTTYTWERTKTTQFSIIPVNLNVIRSTTDSAFNALLDNLQAQGNNLKNSFKPSFVSSMIFTVTWNPNNYGNSTSNSFFLKASLESGGTLNNLYTFRFVSNEHLETYRYVRLNLDMRKSEIIDKHTVVAYRLNSGVAYSYGANKSLPYEKYFFAGGSNGVRAWRPRRLGIGTAPPKLSANPSADGRFDYSYEKPGEMLIEGSVELRKKLFGFVAGAVFVDFGNVWTFKEYPAQTGTEYPDYTGSTKFNISSFYKEFGIGTGFGLRFDFTFLILRLDIGMKAYDPARQEGDRFILRNAKFWKPYGTTRDPVIYNVGIGYPF